MKTLEFHDINSESYDMLYEVVRAYPVKGIEEILTAATIVEKLKEFGVEKGDEKALFKAYKLKTVPCSIEFEDSQFKYIKNCFESVQMTSSVKIELLAQTAKLLKSVE